MAEQDLKRAIQEKVQREKENILAQARLEQEKLLNQARHEASILQETYLAEIKKRYLLKKAQELNRINLAARRQLLEAKEKKITEVLSLVRENLKAIHRNGTRYKSIFKHLLQESQEGFAKGIKLKLKINPDDKNLALEILNALGVNAQLATTESIDGGLELCNLETNMLVLNTFESRLEKLIPLLRPEISKILFENL